MSISARGGFTRRLPVAALIIAVLSLSSCKEPTSTVSGKVTYKGEAVTEGTVNFMNLEKGWAADGVIDANGNYKLAGELKPGTYKVFFQPPLPEQLPPGQVSTKKATFK